MLSSLNNLGVVTQVCHLLRCSDSLELQISLVQNYLQKTVSIWLLTSVRSLCHHSRLAINQTSTDKARPLPSKIQSRLWEAGSASSSSDASILENITKLWWALFAYGSIGSYTGSLSPLSSSHIIDKCVMAILLYGAENWLLVATLESFQAELGKRILTLSKFAANEAPPLHSMLAHYEGKNLVPCA